MSRRGRPGSALCGLAALALAALAPAASCRRAPPPDAPADPPPTPARAPAPPTPAPPASEPTKAAPAATGLSGGDPGAADRPIGRVLGQPLTERDVREALRRARKGTGNRTAALLAAGRKIAAGEATRAGIPLAPGERTDDHVDRFLAATFSPTTSCHDIDDAAIAETWKRLRKRFVHPDVFRVIDLQVICCPKEQAPCRDAEAARCFEGGAARIEDARAAVATARTEAALRAAADAAAVNVPGLIVHGYSFAYDYGRPHHDQGGSWVVMDPAIVDVVRGAEAGTLTEPVRTPYGYHLLWVADHRPPDHRGPDDPTARKEIFDELCEGILVRAREGYLLDLAKNVRPEVDLDAVDAITGD